MQRSNDTAMPAAPRGREALAETLRDNQSRLRQAQELARLGSWEYRRGDGRMLWSDQLYHLLGYAPDAAEPSLDSLLELIGAKDRQRFLSFLEEGPDRPRSFFTVSSRPGCNGEERLFQIRGELRERGGEIVHAGTVQDLTEEKNRQQALWRAELTMRALLDAPRDIFMILDPRGVVQGANSALAKRMGRTVEEFTGENIFDLLPPEVAALRRAKFDLVLSSKSPVYFKDQNAESFFEHAVYPVTGAGGEVIQMVVHVKDVTGRCKLEQKLKASRENLEQRVTERTRELRELNTMLRKEAGERREAEENIRVLSRQLLSAQEDERRRIARDLHDDIAQNLSSLKLLSSRLRQRQTLSGWDGEDDLLEFSRILQDTIDSVRGLSFELLPSVLEQFGLVEAVAQLCHNFSQESAKQNVNALACDFTSKGVEDLGLDFETQINVYRLIQEGLGNIRKHAKANRAAVELTANGRLLTIRIQDDGVGFAATGLLTQALRNRRTGLWSMKSRVELMQGVIELKSSAGRGASITIAVPVKKKPADGRDRAKMPDAAAM